MTRLVISSTLLLGFALGLGLGLFISWGLLPLKHYEGPPSALKEPLKRDYVYLISAAYAQEGDLSRAQARLKSLGYKDLGNIFNQALAELKAEGAPEESLAATILLAQALGVSLPAFQTFIPSPTPTPIPPQSPFPTPTPAVTVLPTFSPTPAPSFILKAQEKDCRPAGELSLLEIEVLDKYGAPLSGIELIISWEGGEERVFTGLKPGKSPGYADFEMESGATYQVRPGIPGSQEAVNLTSSGRDCPPERPVISWHLVFQEVP